MRLALLLLAAACTRADSTPTPGVAPSAPPAALALAKSFAPEVVGTIQPVAPQAGDYAMALKMDFHAFVTAELRISAHRSGAVRFSLRTDGTASACAGVHDSESTQGQYHYEPDPAKRKHSSSTQDSLVVAAGTWKLVDGVAEVVLDRYAGDTCDAKMAIVPANTPPTRLRCIGVSGSALVPKGSLACALGDRDQLLRLGMPMTTKEREANSSHDSPRGTGIVLGAPGVRVVVDADRDPGLPVITFKADATPLVEAEY